MSVLLRNLLPEVVDLPPVRGVAVFIVGEQLNPRAPQTERLACTGQFMENICRLAGISNHVLYLRATSMRRNLFRPGQVMTRGTMVENAELLLQHFDAYSQFYGRDIRARQVLLCGAWARDAFNQAGEWGRTGDAVNACTWIPHPSGRNRFYNDKKNCDHVHRLLGRVFAHVL